VSGIVSFDEHPRIQSEGSTQSSNQAGNPLYFAFSIIPGREDCEHHFGQLPQKGASVGRARGLDCDHGMAGQQLIDASQGGHKNYEYSQ
jgi:hypothetical protein